MFVESRVAGESGRSPSSRDPAPRPSRRVFSAAYKLRIITEYENAANQAGGRLTKVEVGPA